MKRIVLVSDTDYGILTRGFVARLFPPRYGRVLGSDRPLKEFVALARRLAEYGYVTAPASNPPDLASRDRIEVIQIGPGNLDDDLPLLRRYGDRNASEWNRRNLEMIEYFNHYIDLGRRTWNVNLRYGAGQGELRRIFAEHGALFIKSVLKGHAALVTDVEAYLREFGRLDQVSDDSLTLLVSEVLHIREIDASIDGRRVRRTDEWRHHVYRGQRVATTHAFDCDESRTSDEHRARNAEHAEGVAARLRPTDFATSYVLDTCTLEDGRCAVIEANPFFASGIYSPTAVEAIARALGESSPD